MTGPSSGLVAKNEDEESLPDDEAGPNTTLGGGGRLPDAEPGEDDVEETGINDIMYALEPRDVMLNRHSSAMMREVARKRYHRNGSVTISGSAVKMSVYCALVEDSDARNLVRRLSCSIFDTDQYVV